MTANFSLRVQSRQWLSQQSMQAITDNNLYRLGLTAWPLSVHSLTKLLRKPNYAV